MSDIHQNHDEGPALFLIENLALLPRGRALDIAMGSGANAVYLAQKGFVVEGVDISREGVERAEALARRVGVSLKAGLADLEGGYRIPEGSYDVITCFRYLHRPLIPQIKAGLRRGGMVVYETFIIDQAEIGHPRNPDYLLAHNELLDMFRDFRCFRYHQGIIGGQALAGIIAQKVQG